MFICNRSALMRHPAILLAVIPIAAATARENAVTGHGPQRPVGGRRLSQAERSARCTLSIEPRIGPSKLTPQQKPLSTDEFRARHQSYV